MALTAFTSRLGLSQGRLAAPRTADGNYVFVFGDSRPGDIAELAPGDHVQLTQLTDLTGLSLLRVAIDLKVPSSTPRGFAWNASILVDGNCLAATSARSGQARVITDLAANVSKLQGLHDVAVRLELTAT